VIFKKKTTPPLFCHSLCFSFELFVRLSKRPMEQRMSVVVLGTGAVGKTAITVRFLDNKFVERYDPTIEDTFRRQVAIDDEAYLLDIQDTSGQDEFNSIRDQQIKFGDGFIIVYSITSRTSFERAKTIITKVIQLKEDANFPMVLVGNKIDLIEERAVSVDEGKKLAEEFQIPNFQSSAKEDISVCEAFHAVVRTINKWRLNSPAWQENMEKKKKMKKDCVLV